MVDEWKDFRTLIPNGFNVKQNHPENIDLKYGRLTGVDTKIDAKLNI